MSYTFKCDDAIVPAEAMMVPTARLRYAKRKCNRTLQQFWVLLAPRMMNEPEIGEWRDVPSEKESE